MLGDLGPRQVLMIKRVRHICRVNHFLIKAMSD